jgi:hypothetical protein
LKISEAKTDPKACKMIADVCLWYAQDEKFNTEENINDAVLLECIAAEFLKHTITSI